MSSCDIPRCDACQFAKKKRRSSSADVKRPVIAAEGGISNNVLDPGREISVDLYKSSVLGRLPHTKGSESDDEKFFRRRHLSRYCLKVCLRETSIEFNLR
jgi:hypothetical protein